MGLKTKNRGCGAPIKNKMNTMKTIGLIGGMSWESSKVYYEYINTLVQQQLGGSHSAKSIMTSVDFAEIADLSFQGNWEAIGELMKTHALILQNAGADLIVLCSNTIHLVSPNILKATTIPFLHIADATARAIKKQGLKKVGLLGTRFTMEKDFYIQILEAQYGIEVVVPEYDDRGVVHTIIYEELVKGVITKTAKQKTLEVIDKLLAKGAEGIILGCTELPLLISDDDVDVPTFNTTLIHSQQAVDFAINQFTN